MLAKLDSKALTARLPMLAVKINAAHASVKRHIKATIAEMMAAGDDLREAKNLAGHGKWLSWLRTNCSDVSERTAHLYMQFAKWRRVIEEAMAKSATIADLERDQLKVPRGLAVGPFSVADAIAAIHEAEHHENMVKENRLKLAEGKPPSSPPLRDALGSSRDSSSYSRRSISMASIAEAIGDFSNHVKCSLSRIGIDQHQRAEFFKRAHGILDAMEAEQLACREKELA